MDYSGVGIIIEDQDKSFVLHLRDGNTPNMTNQWCLVGGSIEPGEDVVEAAVREVKEETGLTLTQPVHLRDFVYNGKQVALIRGGVDTNKEKMILGEGAGLKMFSKNEATSFLNSLEYSNPYLKEFHDYLLSL